MRTRKPKLASGERVVVDVGATGNPGLGSHSGVVTTDTKKEALTRRAIRSVLGFGILGLLMLFLTYVALASTVFVVMRADDHSVAVLRNTFPVGQAPAGVIVYASSVPIDNSLGGKANQAVFGVPAGSVVEIVAGPAARIGNDKNGYIMADRNRTEYQAKVDTRTLTREYVAICISGACDVGDAVIVSQDAIVGEVKGYLGLSGLTEVKTAP